MNCFHCRVPVFSVRPALRESCRSLEGIIGPEIMSWTVVDCIRPQSMRTTVNCSPCQSFQPVMVRGADWTAKRDPVQSHARTGPDGPWETLGLTVNAAGASITGKCGPITPGDGGLDECVMKHDTQLDKSPFHRWWIDKLNRQGVDSEELPITLTSPDRSVIQ
jgi:hypothetical protein